MLQVKLTFQHWLILGLALSWRQPEAIVLAQETHRSHTTVDGTIIFCMPHIQTRNPSHLGLEKLEAKSSLAAWCL